MTYVQQLRNMIQCYVCRKNRTGLRFFQFLFMMILIIYVWHYNSMQHTESHLVSGRSSIDVSPTCTFTRTAKNTRPGAKKLGFIVGGVQKAGTTALDQYLRLNPYLLLPKKKQAHFFDNERKNWTNPDFRKYEYRGPVQSESHIAGEVTPNYIYWPNSLERIKCYNPDIKLIFIFRQPVDRAWSNWKMSRRVFHETHSFSWAIRRGQARFAKRIIQPGYHRVFSYVEHGFYSQQLKRVLQLFPREQVLLLLNEDMEANPTRMMQQISEFLGVPQIKGKVKQLEANVAPEKGDEPILLEKDAAYLQNLYNKDLKLFAKLSGLNITSWFR